MARKKIIEKKEAPDLSVEVESEQSVSEIESSDSVLADCESVDLKNLPRKYHKFL